MPYKIKKVPNGFRVTNTATGDVLAKNTTLTKANSQVRLLNAIKHNPNFKVLPPLKTIKMPNARPIMMED